jgi:hypothetical protein
MAYGNNAYVLWRMEIMPYVLWHMEIMPYVLWHMEIMPYDMCPSPPTHKEYVFEGPYPSYNLVIYV